jgi:hypothetical protein
MLPATQVHKCNSNGKNRIIPNLIEIILVSMITYYVGTMIFDISEGVFPEWARIAK